MSQYTEHEDAENQREPSYKLVQHYDHNKDYASYYVCILSAPTFLVNLSVDLWTVSSQWPSL